MYYLKQTAHIILALILVFFVRFVYADDITSPSFRIEGDGLSSGAGTGDSTNFGLTGEVNPFTDLANSTGFRQEIGYNPRIQALTPFAPTLDNPSEYYDRLRLIIDTSGNADDVLYAVAVSDDDFATYKYVQSDNTLGDTLGTEDYRTYTSLGGVSGISILGLKQLTTYKAKVKALHGDFTETGWGPESAEATTDVPFINLQVSESALTLGVMNLNSISQTSSATITVNTNAMSGYQVYVYDSGNGINGGLYNGIDTLILSADTVLFPGNAGYGAQASSLSANVDAKYQVSGNTVGALDLASNPLFSNVGAVSGETATVLFKASISPTTISGNYSDTVYFTVTPNL